MAFCDGEGETSVFRPHRRSNDLFEISGDTKLENTFCSFSR